MQYLRAWMICGGGTASLCSGSGDSCEETPNLMRWVRDVYIGLERVRSIVKDMDGRLNAVEARMELLGTSLDKSELGQAIQGSQTQVSDMLDRMDEIEENTPSWSVDKRVDHTENDIVVLRNRVNDIDHKDDRPRER